MSPLDWLPGADLLWLIGLALYALWLLVASLRRSTTRPAALRAIPLYERLQALLSRALETDTPLHVSLGSHGIAVATPEVAQAAALVTHATQIAGTTVHPLEVTVGAPTLLAAVAASGRATTDERGAQHGSARHGLIGVEPWSYAVGAWQVAAADRLAGQVCFGPFGAEGLLLQEGTRASATGGLSLEQLSGTAEIDAAALLYLSSTTSALGEDVYAAGAYLHQPHQQAGLALQDGARMLLLLGMLIGLGLRLAGVWGG